MEWKDMTKNEPAIYTWLPFYVMFAADAFSVNVVVLCYPSEEEVIFYPTKPTGREIRIGLINKQHYVCIIPKDEEKKHTEKVKNLELSIKDLKTRIQLKNNQISELKEKDKKNKEAISRLEAEKGKLEEELAEKEQEKADLIKCAAEEMQTTCQKLTEQLTAKFIEEFALKIAGFTEK
ncbi:DNA ligase 1-like [Saccostrea echinata]|uniref:DNA ligase 1-like n=1 Tax=Saccostrea echinata TaxID=191078 RepID=UPI002A7F138A|nr:DNA ligase 1-like [Saccostrea echinata]